MYWILWLIVGLTLVAIYSTFVLPKVYRNVIGAVSGPDKKRFLYILALAALISAAVFLFVFVVATFICQCVQGLKVGHGKAAPFQIWTIYVFIGTAALLFMLGAIKYRVGGEGEGKMGLRFLLPKFEIDATNKFGLMFDIMFGAAIVVASFMLALFFDYALLELFGSSKSKMILLLLIVLETALIAVAERKKLKNFKDFLPRTVIPLFVAFVIFYVLLVAVSSDVVEWIFVVGGSALFVAIAFFWTWSLVARKFKIK